MPSTSIKHNTSITFRDISAGDLPLATSLLAHFDNFIRPTVTIASLALNTLSIVGAFHESKGLVGLAILQDFGIRKLLSDTIVTPEFADQNIDIPLAKILIERVANAGPGRILSLASNAAHEARLQTLGFETQQGEHYLKRQLPVMDSFHPSPLVAAPR